jgi:hypothetical protein
MGTERRRRRMRRPPRTDGPAVGATAESPPTVQAPRSPTPHDLAGLGDTFAMTAGVMDPDDADADDYTSPEADGVDRPGAPDSRDGTGSGSERNGGDVPPGSERNGGDVPPGSDRAGDDQQGERGLRGLVGGGSSQVGVRAAMRARDAARPTEADLAAADADLAIVRRGWVPREDLPPRGPRR